MKFLTKVVVILCGLGLAWTILFGSWTTTFHEKLTLKVATLNGQKSASATTTIKTTQVFGIVHTTLNGWFNGGNGWFNISGMAKGNAIMLEVTPGRWLFVLRSSPWGTHSYGGFSNGTINIPSNEKTGPRYKQVSISDYLLSHDLGTEVVPNRQLFPAFVTFDDLNDPSTIRLVDPENLAATFGKGVALEGLTLSQTTRAGDDRPIIQLLPWLCAEQKRPTREEIRAWDDLDRRYFSLRQPHNFVAVYCGPK